jgi:hypothetical protein
MRPWRSLGLWIGCLLISWPASGAEPTAGELIAQAIGHMVFRSRGAEMTIRLELRGRGGELRTRTMSTTSRKLDGLSRTMVRVQSPSDVAGTAFLFIEKRQGEAEQYMYLPALKVVKRIVGEQKRARFMGSDFSYADLEWVDLEAATCRRHLEEKIGAHACHVIDCEPRKRGDYRRLRVWVRKQDQAPLRVQFFDDRPQPLKVLYVKELKPVAGVLMATGLRMAHRNGDSTVLQITNIRVRDDLAPSDFTPQALRLR